MYAVFGHAAEPAFPASSPAYRQDGVERAKYPAHQYALVDARLGHVQTVSDGRHWDAGTVQPASKEWSH